MNIGEIKHGFKLLSIEEVKDIDSKLYHYEHLFSGGNVYYLENDDTNCCFAIGFRTPPKDSSGVCHIIEHSMLCGSKKYPLKEPFVNLLKSSLATFLNAFTAYDWTMYPFASQTPKDFDNILNIYCDAVFNPLSIEDSKPFLQEGWHLELNSKDDLPSYKGVVYNEMKGAMSSVDEVLVQTTLESMYRDTFYRFNSGGDPDVIPSLTYEAYKDFYKRHYTPQNAMTYFYGNMDIENKLEFLDREYFSKYSKSDHEIVIDVQKPFIDLNYEKDYEIGEEESLNNNTYMSLCYGLDHYSNYEELLAMQILCDALLSKNDSPIKKALLDAKLGENVEARIDDDNIVPALHIYLQKTNKDKKEEFEKVFIATVKDLVEKGIDRKLLLASINFSEFRDKEMDMGRFPKGLVFAMNMMESFNCRTSITSHLECFKYYDKFRKELNNGYFEGILDKYILNSKHHVEVVLNPSKTLAAEKKALMNRKMKEIKASMSEKEIDDLIKLNQDLIAYQNHIDTKEELATLPKLEIKDIPNTINYLDSKTTSIKNMKAFTHTLNTNKIAYTRLYFNLDVVEYDDLPYVYLLKNLYFNLPTKKYDSLSLTNQVKTYLGDLSFSILNLPKTKDHCLLYLSISSSSLLDNVNYIPKMIDEVILKTKFTKNEIKMVLSQLVTALRQDIIENGTAIASLMAKRHYTADANYSSQCMCGPDLYKFLNNLLKNFSYKNIKAKLEELTKRIYNKDNVIISLSGDKKTLSVLKRAMGKIKLGNEHFDPILKPVFLKPQKEALIIPSGVSYNARANSLENLGYKFNGHYFVLAQIVNYDYLWSEIRVKGGAYGCSLGVNRSNDVAFGTFRDPNVKNSYQVFSNLTEYLKNFKVSKEVFNNYIIGATGGFDSPLSTPLFINSGDASYLTGLTKKAKQNIKIEVLKTKQKDIKNMSQIFEKLNYNCSEYTIGEESKIKEYSFDQIKFL